MSRKIGINTIQKKNRVSLVFDDMIADMIIIKN